MNANLIYVIYAWTCVFPFWYGSVLPYHYYEYSANINTVTVHFDSERANIHRGIPNPCIGVIFSLFRSLSSLYIYTLYGFDIQTQK